MTLATQTWRVSTSYPFTPAGSTATVAEVLSAINSMLVSETASSWGVSAYSAGNGTLEIKRRGTQTGTLAAYRCLIFGGASPHSSALGQGVSANSAYLYAGCADNASTTGPAQAYTVGSPYPSSRWSGGAVAGNPSGVISASLSPYVYMIDSDEMCSIFVNDSSYSFVITFGACIEKLTDNTPVWCCSTSGLSLSAADGYGATYTNTPICRSPANPVANASITYHDGINQRYAFDPIVGWSTSTPGVDHLNNTPYGMLVPIYVSARNQTSAATASTALGVMRQLRYGPNCINKVAVYNNASVLQCYGTSSGYNQNRFGLYFDTVA